MGSKKANTGRTRVNKNTIWDANGVTELSHVANETKSTPVTIGFNHPSEWRRITFRERHVWGGSNDS